VLDGLPDLAGRHPEALGHELEVVDQGLHRGAHDLADVVERVAHAVGPDGELRRPRDLLVGDHHRRARGRLEALDDLVDDPHRLVALLDAQDHPVPAVRALGDRHVEVVGLVAAVRRGLADVVRQAGGPQHRAGDAERHAPGQVQHAHVLQPALEDRLAEHEVLELLHVLPHAHQRLGDRVEGARRDVLRDAAGADVRVVHPQAGDQLEDPQDLLAGGEPDRHDRGRAELVAAGGQAHQVRGDPVELHHQDADLGGPDGDVVGDPEQLLHREAVRGLLEQRGDVVHAGAERHALGPGAELHVLLDAGVQVADARSGLGHRLAVDLEHEPEHAVRGRVLRAHVDDDALLAEAGGLLGDVGPVAARRLEGAQADGLVVDEVPGRVDAGRGLGAHEYCLRWSAGGMVAPLYSTGMPPSG
jgi:hypothetical protein